jgi:hypothetical protein
MTARVGAPLQVVDLEEQPVFAGRHRAAIAVAAEYDAAELGRQSLVLEAIRAGRRVVQCSWRFAPGESFRDAR